MQKIIFTNTEGAQVIFGQQAPFFITGKKGFGAIENDVVTQNQYGLDGEFLVYQALNQRELEIDGEIKASDIIDLQDKREQLSSILNPHLSGTLTYFAVNGGVFEIDVLIEKAPEMDNPPQNLTQAFTITLLATSPFWTDLSQKGQVTQLSSFVPCFKFPLQITSGYIFAGIVAGNIIEIDNPGDVAIGMVILLKITGACVNPRVLNVETQDIFGFAGSYQAGTSFVINTNRGQKEVAVTNSDGTTSNGMGLRMPDSAFLQLQKGANYFSLIADSGEENVIGSVQYNPVVMGV